LIFTRKKGNIIAARRDKDIYLTPFLDVRYNVHKGAVKIMDIKKVLPLTEARKNIFKIIDDVEKEGAFYGLTERGRIKAILMPADEFESWRETLAVMKQFPDLDKSIAAAKKDWLNKKYISLDYILAREGYVLAEKPKTKYESNNPKSKSGKISRRPKRGR
jgi:prevent-host-death family protein